jgi:hypothetical protein
MFHVCFCWFSGIFTLASVIKEDCCLGKFQTIQMSFLHPPFFVDPILIEVSCVCISIKDSSLRKYVVENGNRIIIAILEMRKYSFVTEFPNWIKVSSANFGLKTWSVLFLGFQRKWFSMNTERAKSRIQAFNPTFKILRKLMVRGVQTRAVSLDDWSHSAKYRSVFTFRLKQSRIFSDTPGNVVCNHLSGLTGKCFVATAPTCSGGIFFNTTQGMFVIYPHVSLKFI